MGDAETPATKRRRLDFGDDITVLVGSAEKKFVVHKAQLTKSSGVFKACCADGWREAKDGVIRLPDASVESFATYLHWLYTGDLVVLEDVRFAEVEREKRFEMGGRYCTSTAALAVLADQCADVAFTNAVIDAIISWYNTIQRGIIGPAHFTTLWTDLPKSSKVRELLIAMTYNAKGVGDYLRSQADDPTIFPPDFAYELALCFVDKVEGKETPPKPTRTNRCEFHEHDDKIPKCA